MTFAVDWALKTKYLPISTTIIITSYFSLRCHNLVCTE